MKILIDLILIIYIQIYMSHIRTAIDNVLVYFEFILSMDIFLFCTTVFPMLQRSNSSATSNYIIFYPNFLQLENSKESSGLRKWKSSELMKWKNGNVSFNHLY